jgi:hypothetical protein
MACLKPKYVAGFILLKHIMLCSMDKIDGFIGFTQYSIVRVNEGVEGELQIPFYPSYYVHIIRSGSADLKPRSCLLSEFCLTLRENCG